MLASSKIPESYSEWNKKYGAPFGHSIPFSKKFKRLLPRAWYWRWRGPFSIQPNNTTRIFEYPFVIDNLPCKKSLQLLDIGGGLSGFQFVLSSLGHEVTNVDPGMEASGKGWPCTPASIARLNSLFDTNVKLCNTTVEKADLTPGSFDAVVSISVIEHLPWADVENAIKVVWDILKPGGVFVLTVDLFLDVFPFAQTRTNKYGSNINIYDLTRIKPFVMKQGASNELFGFSDFNGEEIIERRSQYLVGRGYPALVQCLVLEKPLI